MSLTMNVYTDPKLLDVAGAMDALPALPLGRETGQNETVAANLQATGTDDCRPQEHVKLGGPSSLSANGYNKLSARQFAPGFAPNTVKSSLLGSILDKVTAEADKTNADDAVAASAYPVIRKDSLITVVNESWKWAALGSNQRLPPCEDGALTN